MKRKERKKLPFIAKLLIAVVILFTVFLCSAIDSDPSSDTGSNIGSTEEQPTVSNADHAIVDSDAITAYFVKAEDQSALGVFYVVLKIENKTETEIVINLESADVDGESIPLITTGLPLVIRPGNSGQTGFVFSMVNLSISSMDEAKKATFRVVARDNESFDVIFKSDLVTVDLH